MPTPANVEHPLAPSIELDAIRLFVKTKEQGGTNLRTFFYWCHGAGGNQTSFVEMLLERHTGRSDLFERKFVSGELCYADGPTFEKYAKFAIQTAGPARWQIEHIALLGHFRQHGPVHGQAGHLPVTPSSSPAAAATGWAWTDLGWHEMAIISDGPVPQATAEADVFAYDLPFHVRL
jgi:hypothetical protein